MANQISDLLRVKQSARFLGISDATFHRLRKLPGFPPAIQLGTRSRAYRRIDLEKWLKGREVRP